MSEKEGKYIMQAEEFINIVYNSGYATKKNAKKYTEKHPKDSYSDQDFIDVYRVNYPDLHRSVEVGASCFNDPGYYHTTWQFSQNLYKR